MGEMFPLAVMLPAAVLSFATFWQTLYALDGLPARITWRAGVVAGTNLLLPLLLRVYDELKDVETDLRLGRAGDPRYQHRAVVTGHVQVGDIVALRNAVIVALIAINLSWGLSWPLLVFFAVLALFWASSRWFFWPAISRHLLLAFITHNPLTLAIGVYTVAVYLHLRGSSNVPAGAAVLVVGAWMQAAAWEVARKIRRPEDETDYQTYSKVLGWRVAGVLPALLVGLATLCWILVARAAHAPAWLTWALLAGCALVAGSCVRFLVAPSSASSNLRQPVELFGAVVGLAVPLAMGFKYGITFG